MTAKKLLTRRELAGLLNVHAQTIVKWGGAGLPTARRGRRGRPALFDLDAVRGWLAAREAAALAGRGPLDPGEARARRDHWQGLLAKQTVETRAGALLPAAETDQAWSAELEAVRAHLAKVPGRFAERLNKAAADGVPAVETALREMAHEVLSELAAGRHAKRQGRPRA